MTDDVWIAEVTACRNGSAWTVTSCSIAIPLALSDARDASQQRQPGATPAATPRPGATAASTSSYAPTSPPPSSQVSRAPGAASPSPPSTTPTSGTVTDSRDTAASSTQRVIAERHDEGSAEGDVTMRDEYGPSERHGKSSQVGGHGETCVRNKPLTCDDTEPDIRVFFGQGAV